jgi:hypothetical protein
LCTGRRRYPCQLCSEAGRDQGLTALIPSAHGGRQLVAPTFLSAGAGDFPVASSCVGKIAREIVRHGNTGLESPAHPQARKPALRRLAVVRHGVAISHETDEACPIQPNRGNSSSESSRIGDQPSLGSFGKTSRRSLPAPDSPAGGARLSACRAGTA